MSTQPFESLFPSAQAGFAYPKPLAEKYRPVQISDFIGLDKVKKILSAFSARPTVSAWTFVGPAGTGKTTMAQALCSAIGGEFHHLPSGKCDARAIDDVVRQCWYAPMNGTFHVVVVDEADRMTEGAQLALLSKLDSTAAPPQTIWIFTCNQVDGLEKRFLSRCRVLEFSSYGMRESLAELLARVWQAESTAPTTPDFMRIAKDATNNVRTALMALELELLAQ
jgi:replication-associated recombination protein RarA